MASIIIPTNVTLNLLRPNSNVVVYAKQYDKASRQIEAKLVCGSSTWDPPSNATGIIKYSKSDGKIGVYDIAESYPIYSNQKTYRVGDHVRRNSNIYRCVTAINTPENWNSNHWTLVGPVTPAVSKVSTGVYKIILAEQALTCPGNVYLDVCFYTSEAVSTTFSFIVNVEKSPANNTAIESSDYFNILEELIEGLLGASSHPPIIDSVTRNWMLWNESNAQYEDSGYSSVGIQGPPGVITVESNVRYQVGTSGTTPPSGTWLSNIPEVDPGEYLWIRTITTFGDGTSTTAYSVSRNPYDADGSPGMSDPLPDGPAAVVGGHVAYAHEDHRHPSTTLYFTNVPVSVANNAEIMRISNNLITTDTVLIGCTFANGADISSDVTWTSYDGYISFVGTCTSAMTANVTLGTKRSV